MTIADIAMLAGSKLTAKAAELWQLFLSITNDETDVEGHPECEVYQALGVTSLPYPKDANGFAEALFLRDVGGRSCVAIGGRDTRSKIAAGLKPGDVCLHATGPSEAAQVRCIEKKRMVACVTRDGHGETMSFTLDGVGNKSQWLARGSMIQIDDNGDITFTNGAASILMQGEHIYFNGTVHLPGMTPGMALMQGPPTGSPGGSASVPMQAVKGVGR